MCYKPLFPVLQLTSFYFIHDVSFLRPVLLRYNWHPALCKFKVYNKMIWCTCIMKWWSKKVWWTSPHIDTKLKKQKKTYFSSWWEFRHLSCFHVFAIISTASMNMFCLFVCVFFASSWGFQDASSPTRDWTRASEVKAPSPNHWTAREFPLFIL